MTDEELIARLRGDCYLAFDNGTNDYGTAPDAADRIEALVKQCEDLAQAAMNNGQALILAEARICELEARLAEPPAVTVKPLVWDDFHGRGAKAQAWNDANYMIQKWNDGRWEISASYPGYSTFIEGADRFYPTLEAAKSAAQADYAARILPAIDARPASAVRDEVLEEAARQVRYSAPRAWFSVDVDRVMAAIRALKGGEA